MHVLIGTLKFTGICSMKDMGSEMLFITFLSHYLVFHGEFVITTFICTNLHILQGTKGFAFAHQSWQY